MAVCLLTILSTGNSLSCHSDSAWQAQIHGDTDRSWLYMDMSKIFTQMSLLPSKFKDMTYWKYLFRFLLEKIDSYIFMVNRPVPG